MYAIWEQSAHIAIFATNSCKGGDTKRMKKDNNNELEHTDLFVL